MFIFVQCQDVAIQDLASILFMTDSQRCSSKTIFHPIQQKLQITRIVLKRAARSNDPCKLQTTPNCASKPKTLQTPESQMSTKSE